VVDHARARWSRTFIEKDLKADRRRRHGARRGGRVPGEDFMGRIARLSPVLESGDRAPRHWIAFRDDAYA